MWSPLYRRSPVMGWVMEGAVSDNRGRDGVWTEGQTDKQTERMVKS